MSRGMTEAMDAAVAASVVRPVLFAKFEFDSGTVFLWTGLGDKAFGGDTYTGAGDLFTVSEIRETLGIAANGLKFTLSSIDPTILSLALNEDYQGRPCTAWLAALDAAEAIVVDPEQVWAGRMDVMEGVEGALTTTISLDTESVLIDLERARELRYTDEEQQRLYPGDTGLAQVVSLQDVAFVWGPG